jgi:hypothetical protein
MRTTGPKSIWLVLSIFLTLSYLSSCSRSVPGWTNKRTSSINPQTALVGSWTESRGYDATFYKNGQYIGGNLASGEKGSKIEKGTWELFNDDMLTVTYHRKEVSFSNQVEVFFQSENQFTTFIQKGPLSAQNLFSRKGVAPLSGTDKSTPVSVSDDETIDSVATESDEEFEAPSEDEMQQAGTRKERTKRRIFVAYPLLVFLTGSLQVGGNDSSFESDGFITSGISAGFQLAPNSVWGLGLTQISIPMKGEDSTLATTMIDLMRGYDEEGWGDEIGYAYFGAGSPSISCSGCTMEEFSGLGYQFGFVFAPSPPGLTVKIGYYGGMLSYSGAVDARLIWHSITSAIGYEF